MLACAEGSTRLPVMEFQPLMPSFGEVCSGTAVEHILNPLIIRNLCQEHSAGPSSTWGGWSSSFMSSASIHGLWKTHPASLSLPRQQGAGSRWGREEPNLPVPPHPLPVPQQGTLSLQMGLELGLLPVLPSTRAGTGPGRVRDPSVGLGQVLAG